MQHPWLISNSYPSFYKVRNKKTNMVVLKRNKHLESVWILRSAKLWPTIIWSNYKQFLCKYKIENKHGVWFLLLFPRDCWNCRRGGPCNKLWRKDEKKLVFIIAKTMGWNEDDNFHKSLTTLLYGYHHENVWTECKPWNFMILVLGQSFYNRYRVILGNWHFLCS